jgi:hypothetical protein
VEHIRTELADFQLALSTTAIQQKLTKIAAC